MAHNYDFVFDVSEHFVDQHAGSIDMTVAEAQPYADRIVGTRHFNGGINTERVVVLIRPVGAENSARFQRWVTYRVADWESMTIRPVGWHYYVLMVGLLPDGGLWWSRLYDEKVLAQPDVYQFADQVGSAARGGFYRFDPELAKRALVSEYDALKPAPVMTPDRIVTVVYRCNKCGFLVDYDDPAEAKACSVCGSDEPLFIYKRDWPPIEHEV